MDVGNPETLAFLALALVSVAVAAFARRSTRARATYGFIWERIAAKRRRPAFAAIVRRVVGVILVAAILAGLVVSAAEPSWAKPPIQVEALDVVMVLDTSPSTVRRTATGVRSLSAITERAGERIGQLGPYDRAWLVYLQHGAAVVRGPYGSEDAQQVAADLTGLASDFVPSSTVELAKAARQIADAIAAASSAKARLGERFGERLSAGIGGETLDGIDRSATGRVVCITDDDARIAGVASLKEWPHETFPAASLVLDVLGTTGEDAAFTSVEAVGDGRVRVVARGGKRLRAEWFSGADASGALMPDADGGVLVDLLLPPGESGIRLTLDAPSDPIPENNTLELTGQPAQRVTIGLVTPDELAKALMRARMGYLTPDGVVVHDRLPNNVMNDALVIAHGTGEFGVGEGVRLLVCFGQLPPGIGETEAPQLVRTEVSGLLTAPAWLAGADFAMAADGIELKSLRPLSLGEADWQVLYRDERVGPLVYAKRFAGLDVVYVAADGFDGGFLKHPAMGLLLRRMLARGALPAVRELEVLPLARTGDVLGLGEGAWRVTVRSPFLWEPTEFDVLPGADGLAGLAHTWYPGTYRAEPIGDGVVSGAGGLGGGASGGGSSGSGASGGGQPTESPSRAAILHRVQWLADPLEISFAGSPSRLGERVAGLGAIDGDAPRVPEQASPEHRRGEGRGQNAREDQASSQTMSLAHTLLLIAMGLMLIEWLLYWIGWSD